MYLASLGVQLHWIYSERSWGWGFYTVVSRKLFCSTEADCFIWLTQQDIGAEHSQDVALSDSPPPRHQEEQPSAVPDGEDAGPLNTTEPGTKDQEEIGAEEGTLIQTEQQKTEEEEEEEGGESDEEESKGLKRKREEMHKEEEAGPSTEKKRVRNLWPMVHLQLGAKTTILNHSNMVRCRNFIS